MDLLSGAIAATVVLSVYGESSAWTFEAYKKIQCIWWSSEGRKRTKSVGRISKAAFSGAGYRSSAGCVTRESFECRKLWFQVRILGAKQQVAPIALHGALHNLRCMSRIE